MSPSLRAPSRPQRLALVLVGDYISVYGLRKIAAAAREIVPEVRTHFVTTGGRLHSIKNILFSSKSDKARLSQDDIAAIAAELSSYDLVGFSSMTIDSDWVKQLIAELKRISPQTYVLWGGIHPIVEPEDAIQHADAICVGEGDLAFDELLGHLMAGEDYTDVRNFWFRTDDGVQRNTGRPLMTPEEMMSRPHPLYAEREEEVFFERDKGFVPLELGHYLDFDGLAYHTLWTQGCPYRCSYCSNTAFLAIDKKYARIRHTDPEYVIAEVKAAVRRHPHINTVVFDDDAMAALPASVLRDFAQKWKREVGIPFFVAGVIPSYVDREKVEILLEGGMNRLRMGIQSGSDAMLKFFKRPNKPGLILAATRINGDYTRYMIPPAYDLIVDIPVEQIEDVKDTIRLVHQMPKPFTLNVFSLRIIPGTKLAEQIQGAMDSGEIEIDSISANYHTVAPTKANALLFLAATFSLPNWLFERMLKAALPARVPQPQVPFRLFLARALFFIKRGLSDLRFMDFSVLPGRVGWRLWKLGFVSFWQRHFVRRFQAERDALSPGEGERSLPAPKLFDRQPSDRTGTTG